METFIFPTLALLHTDLARGCLQYRADRSLAAAYNARDSDEVGLCFPWQSSVTGRSLDGCGDEQHITGDIAVAVWQYWCMTRDVEWLTSIGWPLLRGIATFWAARATRGRQHGEGGDARSRFSILSVTDVDEFQPRVNNSAWTLGVASRSLSYATTAARILGTVGGSNWTEIAQGLLLSLPRDKDLIFECDGATRANKEGKGNGLGVIMLQYPLGLAAVSERVAANDLEYYAPQLSAPANAMARWPWTVNLLALGNATQAQQFFATTTASVLGDFRQWTEYTGGGGCPNFLTGAGGYLQQLWAGYAGIRIEDNGLRLTRPRCPPASSSLTISGLSFGGCLVRVQIVCDIEEMSVTSSHGQLSALRHVRLRVMDELSPRKSVFQTLWVRGPDGVAHTLSGSDIDIVISDNAGDQIFIWGA